MAAERVTAKILLVDDDEAVLETLGDIFTMWGCAARLARSGQSALRMVQAERPDLVLMDIRMPRMNGIQAMRAMRSIAPSMRIALMSAYPAPTLIDDGQVEVLRKPLDFDRILALVRSVAGDPAPAPSGV
jgi:DNA-binding NtrC family response regulator